MIMNVKRFVAFVVIIIGILISLSRVALTGAVIGEGESSFLNLAGAVIVLGGIILLVVAERESGLERKSKVLHELEEGIRSGRVGSYDELRSYAERLGYDLKEGARHVLVKDDRGNFVATIPRHSRNVHK